VAFIEREIPFSYSPISPVVDVQVRHDDGVEGAVLRGPTQHGLEPGCGRDRLLHVCVVYARHMASYLVDSAVSFMPGKVRIVLYVRSRGYLGGASSTSGMTSLPMKMSSSRVFRGSSLGQESGEDSKLLDCKERE